MISAGRVALLSFSAGGAPASVPHGRQRVVLIRHDTRARGRSQLAGSFNLLPVDPWVRTRHPRVYQGRPTNPQKGRICTSRPARLLSPPPPSPLDARRRPKVVRIVRIPPTRIRSFRFRPLPRLFETAAGWATGNISTVPAYGTIEVLTATGSLEVVGTSGSIRA